MMNVRRFLTPAVVIGLLAVALAAADTWVFLQWAPSVKDTVSDYLGYLDNLDASLRRFKALEPVYLITTGSFASLSGLSFLTTINVSRFVIELLLLFFVGLIVYELTRRWWLTVPAMLVINGAMGFWALSNNLIRNFLAVLFMTVLVWVIIKLLREPRSWVWRIVAALLLAAVVETHIVVAVVAAGSLALSVIVWLIQWLVIRRSELWEQLRSFFVFGGLAAVITLPYDYVRFFLQQFYLTHEFVVAAPNGVVPGAHGDVGNQALTGLGGALEFIYRLVVEFNPLSIERTVYIAALVAAVTMLVVGIRRRQQAYTLLSSFFLFTFLASRNDLMGIRLLPERFDLMHFLPATLLLFAWLGHLGSAGSVSRRVAMMAAMAVVFFQLSYNVVEIAKLTHVSEIDLNRYFRTVGNAKAPPPLWTVISPDELRRGRYTGPTTIQGFEDYIVTRTPDSLEFFETDSAELAWQIARDFGVRYIYLDSLHYNSYHDRIRRRINLVEDKFYNQRYFIPLYRAAGELSTIQLFQVREKAGTVDLIKSSTPPVVPAEITSTDAARTLQKIFAESKVAEWTTVFSVDRSNVTFLQEHILTTDGRNYLLTNEQELAARVYPGTFFTRLEIDRPATQFDRWRVYNTVKGFISDGFVFGPLSDNLTKRISWRVEQRDFALYSRFDVDAKNPTKVWMLYLTTTQLKAVVSLVVFLLTAVAGALVLLFDRRRSAGAPVAETLEAVRPEAP